MSEKTKKTNKSHRKNSDKTNVYLTSLSEPKPQRNICFPEWADEEVHMLPGTVISQSHARKSRERMEKLDKSKKGEKSDEFARRFEDTQVLFLPFCFQDTVEQWRRPSEAFTDYQFVIYKEDSNYSDLLNGSAHIVQSSLVRSFISTILNLEYLAKTTNFCQEATTLKYVPNTSGHWKPWHHVYGTSKVGAHTVHNPQVNSMGRYCVRLFWLGAWRRIMVDDYLPVDATGHVLLPSFPIPKKPSIYSFHVAKPSSAGSKERDKQKGQKSEKEATQPTVILWPFLLFKALLKLANLTMKSEKELLDFNIAHCLTGWMVQTVKLKDLRSEDVWEICKKHAKVYSWNKGEEGRQSPTEKRGVKKGKETGKVTKHTPRSPENFYYLMAVCKDLRFPKQNAVNGMSPCWGHEIVINECRDVPLERPPPEPEYPAWKKFRWTEWAKSKGMITEYIPMDTTKYLKCFSPLKKFSKLVVYTETQEEEKVPKFPLRKSIAALTNIIPILDSVKKPLEKEVSETQKSLLSKDKKKQSDHPTDLTMWLRFDELYANLDSIHVFYKPSSFAHKSRVSDQEFYDILQFKQNKSNAIDTWHDVTWTNTVKERCNAPLYFFIDSLETKMILINLEQTGDQKRLLPLEEELNENNFFVEYEKLFGQQSKSQEETNVPTKKMKLNRERIHKEPKKSNVVFEEFRWDSPKTGKAKFFLNSYGCSCSIIELEPGRHIFRVWIKSWYSYCMTILSDTIFSLGCFEQILENMAEEPMRMTRFSLNISYCFAMLVQWYRTSHFVERLHEYHRCYLPEDSLKKLSKMERMVLHQAFQRSLHQYIEISQDFDSSEKIIQALRVLFVDKAFHVFREIVSTPNEPFQFQSYQERKICEKAATTLQAFFKGIQVRKLLAKHSPSNKHSSEIYEVLKFMYSEFFSLEKRDHNLGIIMRNFFQDEKLSSYVNFYEFSTDFRWDVTIQTFVGISEPIRGYVVLTRCSLRCSRKVLLAIHLFCSITNYVLRIIDNDTTKEEYRFTNSVCPMVFKPNDFGYTVTAFAWCDEIKPINWKLVVISSRNSIRLFEIEEMPTTTISTFDNYVPICEDLIGKYSIFVNEDVVLTLRFSCSYKDAKFELKLHDPDGELMMDIVGVQKIVLPAVLLKFFPMDDQEKGRVMPSSLLGSFMTDKTINRMAKEDTSQSMEPEPQAYSLEFYVLGKSWPLSRKEWEVTRKLREETYFSNVDPSKDTNDSALDTKGIPRTSTESKKSMTPKTQPIEKPWYLLQYSLRPREQAVLVKNKVEEEKILNMKKSWYENDPERYARSMELRQRYLERYMDPGCQCPEEYRNLDNEESMGKLTDLTPESDSRLMVSKEDEEEEDVERTNDCPRWTEAEIPQFDLSPYFIRDSLDSGQRRVKTEEDHAKDEIERQRMIEEYNENLEKGTENRELWINESKERMTLTSLWYTDIRKASENIFQENYVMRTNFFDKWAAELAPPKKTPTKKERK